MNRISKQLMCKRGKNVCIALLVVLGLSACARTPTPKPGDPYYAPTVSSSANLPQRTEGSLFQQTYGLSLFDDRKALRVGDIITISLTERTVSRKSSGVNVKKESSTDFNAGPLLGTVPSFNGNT